MKLSISLPSPGILVSVARYWSPKAWRPITIGFVQPGTRRGMFEITIGSRKITPPRMLRIVPFGERYIAFSPNSSTRASSGVIVAHLTPTPCCLDRVRGIDRDLVLGRVAAFDPEIEVLQLDVDVGQDQLLLDERPDDPGHLVAVELDDRVLDLHLRIRHRAGDATRFRRVGVDGGENPATRTQPAIWVVTVRLDAGSAKSLVPNTVS